MCLAPLGFPAGLALLPLTKVPSGFLPVFSGCAASVRTGGAAVSVSMVATRLSIRRRRLKIPNPHQTKGRDSHGQSRLTIPQS